MAARLIFPNYCLLKPSDKTLFFEKIVQFVHFFFRLKKKGEIKKRQPPKRKRVGTLNMIFLQISKCNYNQSDL